MDQKQLKEYIVERSEAGDFDDAVHEWELDRVELSSDPETCPCGQFPIKELCWIKNKNNDITVFVGNRCIKRFMGVDHTALFTMIRKLDADAYATVPETVLNEAYGNRKINDWEWQFYFDIFRKRNLSVKQLDRKRIINVKIRNAFS